jgi:predicted NUDIX family phosphoesterase
MGKMDEKILAVDRKHLFNNEGMVFQGLLTNERALDYFMTKFREYKEVRRGDVEDDSKWKQPIPSVILKRGEEVFVYKRLSAGGEARLHDQLSITVGGHMNRVNDVRSWETNLIINLQRELHEEVDIRMDSDTKPQLIGLINDDSNNVGLHHIGILYLIDLPISAEVTVKETDQLEGYWIRAKDLTKSPLFESLESWSKLAVEVLL